MNKLTIFLEKHHKKILWFSVVIYTLIFTIICLWKYNHFLYNALDLAIINNVFYNTLHGNWWWSSIQGHSYLGDHFTPILILLLPFYKLWPTAESLLILQSFFLALTAWPIYLISQLILNNKKLSLGLALLWLINPLIHNINLFEFHFISSVPLAILMVFYFYLKLKENFNKKTVFLFFIFILLSLFIREDVAFILIILLLILLLTNLKNKKIILVTSSALLFIFGWLLLSIKLIGFFSPSNFSPFIYYYQWLWQSNIVTVFSHLINLNNFEMLTGLLLPFLFIPLIKPKWLLLAIIPLGQIILSISGGGALIWQMHYGALFLPAIILAFIYGFKRANSLINKYFKTKYLLLISLFIINIYLWQAIGPFNINKNYKTINENIYNEINELAKNKTTSILSSYKFLSTFSSRKHIYTLNYFFLGQQQFGVAEYKIERIPDYIIIDGQDLINFNVQLANLIWSKKYYSQGDNRLKKLLADYGIVTINNDIIIFKKNYYSQIKLLDIKKTTILDNTYQEKINSINKIKLIDYSWQKSKHGLKLSLSLQKLQPINDDYQLSVELNNGKDNYKKILPLAYGIYPTSKWQDDEIITINYWFNLPKNFKLNQISTKINFVKLSGGLEMAKLGMTKLVIDKQNIIETKELQKLKLLDE